MSYDETHKQYVLSFYENEIETIVYLSTLRVDFLYHLITKTRKEVYDR